MSKDPGSPKPDAPASLALHVPLPAALIGLGLMAAPLPALAQAGGIAVNDHYATSASTTLSGVNVTSNDSLVGNATVAVFQISSPSHGVASLSTSGLLTYQPNPGFVGQDAFDYDLVNNGNSVATVFIAVGSTQAVPALAPFGVAALSAGIAALALSRRRKF